MAYFRVHSLAVDSYRDRSVLYTCAISGTSGSSGFGSVSIEQMLRSTVRSVRIIIYTSRPWGLLALRDGQSRAPLISQNIQADAAIRVDVRVVDARREVDFRRLEGIVGREVDCEEEDAARVW